MDDEGTGVGRTVRIGLTCDLGRRYEELWIEADREVWPLVSGVFIPCGGHAGDPRSMLLAVAEAAARGLPIGASLGYRDPVSGGERPMGYTSDDLAAELLYQLGGLDALVVTEGAAITSVRAAGALHEAVLTDRGHAWAMVNAVLDFDDSLTVVAPTGSQLLATAERHGLATAVEHHPYLLPTRGAGPGALLTDPAEVVEQALAAVAAGGVDTVWLPSATTAERATVQAVHRAFARAGYAITSAGASTQPDDELTRFGRRAG